VGLVQPVGLGVGVGVGGDVGVGVGAVVGVGVGKGVEVGAGVAVGGDVGVGVFRWWPLLALTRTMAKQRAWPTGTAPQAWINEYPTPAGAGEAAPALLTSTRALTLREKMATSVARTRTPRRMPDNPSYAHADNTRPGPPIAAGHAAQALANSLAFEVEVEGDTWTAETNRCGWIAKRKQSRSGWPQGERTRGA
jgi:hypothetical protein